MDREIKQLLRRYAITHGAIAMKVGRSRSLVSLVISGERADVSGVVDAAMKLIQSAQRAEQRQAQKISKLVESADIHPAA